MSDENRAARRYNTIHAYRNVDRTRQEHMNKQQVAFIYSLKSNLAKKNGTA